MNMMIKLPPFNMEITVSPIYQSTSTEQQQLSSAAQRRKLCGTKPVFTAENENAIGMELRGLRLEEAGGGQHGGVLGSSGGGGAARWVEDDTSVVGFSRRMMFFLFSLSRVLLIKRIRSSSSGTRFVYYNF